VRPEEQGQSLFIDRPDQYNLHKKVAKIPFSHCEIGATGIECKKIVHQAAYPSGKRFILKSKDRPSGLDVRQTTSKHIGAKSIRMNFWPSKQISRPGHNEVL
jgi:hypothetical protein